MAKKKKRGKKKREAQRRGKNRKHLKRKAKREVLVKKVKKVKSPSHHPRQQRIWGKAH